MAETYVVDGSVALKWFLDDELGLDVARRLLRLSFALECYLIAPSILSYEVPNGLLNAAKRDRIPSSRLQGCLDEFLKAGITLFEHDAQAAPETMSLCTTHGLTFYDASYLALARSRDAVLAVGDAPLAAAAEAEGVRVLRIGL